MTTFLPACRDKLTSGWCPACIAVCDTSAFVCVPSCLHSDQTSLWLGCTLVRSERSKQDDGQNNWMPAKLNARALSVRCGRWPVVVAPDSRDNFLCCVCAGCKLVFLNVFPISPLTLLSTTIPFSSAYWHCCSPQTWFRSNNFLQNQLQIIILLHMCVSQCVCTRVWAEKGSIWYVCLSVHLCASVYIYIQYIRVYVWLISELYF